MSYGLVFSDAYVQEVVSDRLREAERERLAALVSGPGRPIRVRVAGWLFAVARRIEGQPQATIARAEA
ncbi:MAG TPA: hypothetical protein VGJ60_21925 [Chloroflexota bacterium]|jgi:hypothetical protein